MPIDSRCTLCGQKLDRFQSRPGNLHLPNRCFCWSQPGGFRTQNITVLFTSMNGSIHYRYHLPHICTAVRFPRRHRQIIPGKRVNTIALNAPDLIARRRFNTQIFPFEYNRILPLIIFQIKREHNRRIGRIISEIASRITPGEHQKTRQQNARGPIYHPKSQ